MLRFRFSSLSPYLLYSILVLEEVYCLDVSDLSLSKASQHLNILQEQLYSRSLKEYSEKIEKT